MILELALRALKKFAVKAGPAPLLVADLFSGAGGFTEGARQALARAGLTMKVLLVNHWGRALETNKLNHPDADARQVNVYKLEPLDALPDGELDVLMASPTCVYYSRSRGGRPTSWDQRWGRMSPTQVKRWCSVLRPRVVIIENVIEFRAWGPICKNRTRCKKHNWLGPSPNEPNRDICGKPRKNKAGIYFRRWCADLRTLGYKLEEQVLNAADFGDATTRKRLFLVGMLEGNGGAPLIRWPAPTHAEFPEVGDMFSPRLLPWKGAREVIEWEHEGKSIFERSPPHAEKTLQRIYRGIVRYRWGWRFVLKLKLFMESLGYEVPKAVPDKRGRRSSRLVARTAMGKSNALCVRPDSEPLPTVTTDGGLAVVEPALLVLRQHADMQEISKPLPTLTADGKHVGLVEPFLLAQHFDAAARSPSRPLPSPVAINRTALVEPFTFPLNQGRERARGDLPVSQPLGTVVTREMRALVEPIVLNRHGENGGSRARSVGAPLPTATASGAGYLVEPAFVLSQASGGAAREVSSPLPTIPTEGAHALVAPYHGASECKSVEDPLGTATTRDRFGLVVPVTHEDGSDRTRSLERPLPAATASRELAFVTATFGERSGQAARVRSVDEPLWTLCADGYVPLVEGITLADLGDVDIRLRMLRSSELARSMGFDRYVLTGSETERTRQVGNAVAVGVARELFASVVLGLVAA